MPAAAPAVLLAAAAAGWPGPYNVSDGVIAQVPGLTQPAPHAADVVYATGAAAGTLPLLVFGHGYGSGGSLLAPRYHTLLHSVASFGFVVVAPQSCPTQGCGSYYKDMLATIAACRANSSLHPALASANLTRVGVFGHSQGGVATVEAAAHDGYGIAAAAANHPCNADGGKVRVPTMFITGSSDPTCGPRYSEAEFAADPTPGKVLFVIDGAVHEEPTDCCPGPTKPGGCGADPAHPQPCPNREDAPAARFLACHIKGEYCDDVQRICEQDFKLSECKVQ